MHEDDGGPGSILRVCAHRFLLAEGITPSSLGLMVAIRGEAVNRGYSRFALTLLNEQVSENNSCETVRKASEMSGAWPYGPPKKGTFRPILSSVYRPNLRLEHCSDHF